YARRTGFLYEWLTGHQLGVPDVDNGGYIEAISSDQYLTRTDATRVRRWRINNNLPGTVDFCPIVRRTPAVQEALQFDLGAAL
ncbi:cell filamentation protein Fic, partial [Escherichia coli]